MFVLMRKTDTLVSDEVPKFKDFLFLHGMSIFTCFGAMSLKSSCFSFDFVCWLAKIANHSIKTMEKRKF